MSRQGKHARRISRICRKFAIFEYGFNAVLAKKDFNQRFPSSDDGATVGTDSGLNGDFTLSITGTVTTVTFGIETAVTIPTVTITNILAPDANDDFEVLIEDTGFDVTGAVEVTVINNTTDRVTFGLVFEGTTDGIDATFDLVYDYQR